jgi:anti-sigma B factor antagonist
MLPTKITMNVIDVNATTSIIEINGEITAFAESALMDAYNQVSKRGLRTLILDFTRLDYMNSSGIGLLITLLVRANRQGQKIIATGLNEHYQRIFELTRLNEAIRLFPNVEAALAPVNAVDEVQD